MLKKVCIIFLYTSYVLCAQKQEDISIESNKISKHALYFEFGGKSLFYSLNHEITLTKQSRLAMFSFSYGIGYLKEKYSPGLIGLPVCVNLNIGKKQHKLEVGLGQTLFLDMFYQTDDPNIRSLTLARKFGYINSNVILQNTFSLGYKRMPINGGVYFKANAILFFSPIKINTNRTNYFDQEGELIYEAERANSILILNYLPFVGVSIGYCFKSK